ncbi:2OG-Fe(II) oxygenase [Rhodococcus sp. ACPA4]|uniref:isopenicillin N synthase family dioxygenase n=1 Tax=Rhodococcus TaxID=1827 RepID=UPI000BB15A7D|nr:MULTISPECIES: 2-oxoglutarate and iron-dependent oxygenase domain-containing protein [Rhodococcus]MCE4264516.1 isopenicillin N synthase family oxygenase [Rhodococcus globerulus]PBC37503.1 2OG-Fe(II) oxygenase [Rhodococcus sp. ACPA4]
MNTARSVDGALEVPLIDISAFPSGTTQSRRQVAEAVDRAACDVGFMQIVGHGIPDSTLQRLIDAMDDFFALPESRKIACTSADRSVNRGYTARETERLSYSLGVCSPDDLFEAFNIGTQVSDFPAVQLPSEHYPDNIWPDDATGRIRRGMSEWFAAAGDLAVTMTRVFAVALGLDEDYFADSQSHSMDIFRMNNYQLPRGDMTVEPGQLGMGAHTDYGILTILWADAVRGLQILDQQGEWHDVIPAPGALLINLGDLLARWTNNRWTSTMHRVLAPIDENGQMYRRRSAAYFHDGNFDAVISVLPGCADVLSPVRYEPITVADHLSQKLAGSRGLQLNQDAAEDASRLRQAVG